MFYDCNVVLLTTGKESNLKMRGLDGSLHYTESGFELFKEGYLCKQLYVTVTDKIVIGDWCVHVMGDAADSKHQLIQANSSNVDSIQEWWNKVVATTDKFINRPTLSDAFIELYTQRYKTISQIDKALIEYERWITNFGRPFVVRDDYPITQRIFEEGTGIRVVINSDGFVNIIESINIAKF